MLSLPDLYRRDGRYRYAGGWNWRALAALGVGVVLSVGGAYSSPDGSGPFPVDGIIPFLKPLYNYDWAVGFGAAIIVYYGLTRLFPGRERPLPAPAVAVPGK
jgi:NCS1 family nucleobase:cation symporter-1